LPFRSLFSDTLARTFAPYESAALDAPHRTRQLELEQTREQSHAIDARTVRQLIEIVRFAVKQTSHD
jgi:hypothetical protein